MPAWAVLVIGIASVVTAVGVIWTKGIRPLTRGLSMFDRNVPVLLEIAAQFRSDSGSTLRDVVNRLEAAANENKATTNELKVALEGARQLASVDRERVDRRLTTLANLDAEKGKKADNQTAAVVENTEANIANTAALQRDGD